MRRRRERVVGQVRGGKDGWGGGGETEEGGGEGGGYRERTKERWEEIEIRGDGY